MGCSTSKNATTPDSDIPISLKSSAMTQKTKARLEWKMCQSKETPEPYFDLSECALSRIPSGVFVLCKVLRKETLNLSHNHLDSLQSGGIITDLVLLHTLNLNYNRFSKLPDDFIKLDNLRELFLANNQLDTLPANINKLNNLQHFDLSNNRLSEINQINCMPNLRILNISGNQKLTELPFELSTCDSLVELIFDQDVVQHPPRHISAQSTVEVIKYLLSSERAETSRIGTVSSTKELDSASWIGERTTSTFNHKKQHVITDHKQQYSPSLIENEIKCNEMLHRKLHEEQLKRKDEFLKQLVQQQGETDEMALKLQEDSDIKRVRLIENIAKEEEKVGSLVKYWLSSRHGSDAVLLEKERHEYEQLVSQLHLDNGELRRQEIILEMAQMLHFEENVVQEYNRKREDTSRRVTEQESRTNVQLNEVFKNRGLENSYAIVNMLENENMQKKAVEALIARNDSRTWGLVEQVRIIETQLATITHCENARKKLTTDETLVDICEERTKLTVILLDLLAQQAARKDELLNSIKCVELQREDQQQDFWLLQYQKLLDSQPKALVLKSSNIDPLLGHQLLISGVIHYIPLLADVLKQCNDDYAKISDVDLTKVGIKNTADRIAILQAIKHYYEQQSRHSVNSESSVVSRSANETSTSSSQASEMKQFEENSPNSMNECVICMEKTSNTIFIPCGHLCCCIDCQDSLTQCPMCRAAINQKIKVIPM